METRPRKASPQRILLTGVFGPFGVDDDFGRKENIMELFHNQVTREQGLASFRFTHRSFGLYFLAENIDGDVTVLDFPSRDRFRRELRKGFDVVGISFIAPNFVKARAMAADVRATLPGATIVLGGHGAAMDDIETLIDCDHVVRGEGISGLRRILGQDPGAPMRHPTLPSSERTSIHGVPVLGTAASLLVPGVGCVNGCAFCSTSHFFGREYTPFLSTGRQLFETCCHIADARGTDEFFVMDENFLKDRVRADELLAEMERHGRYFEFQIFSSAEAVTAFGVDNLVRLGVTFIWIGIESSTEEGNYAKNRGIDPGSLIRELRARGILVLASGILCMEHHTPQNIGRDIDFMIGLEADFVQFMLLTPLPTTTLYEDHRARGLLRDDLPWEEWHGQHELSYRHPAFPGDTAARCIKGAFRKEYEENGSSMLRVVETSLRGVLHLRRHAALDDCLAARLRGMERRLRNWSPILPTVAAHAVNDGERGRALRLREEIRAAAPPAITARALELATRVAAAAWKLRLALRGDVRQPSTIHTRYPAGAARAGIEIPRTCPSVATVVSRKLSRVG
jgi:hypothetical protein